MKIAINTSHQRFGGAIQVALSFINECQRFTKIDFFVWVGPGLRKSLNAADFPSNFSFEYFDFGVITFQKTFVINNTMRAVEKRVKPDVIIATSGPTYFNSYAPQIIGYNLPLYIYPESPYLLEQSMYSKFRRYLKKQLHFYFFKRDADYYVVQTDDVNKRLRQTLKVDNVLTVTNTASHYYQVLSHFPNKLPAKRKGVFRIVTISSYYGHKNLEIIPKIHDILKKRGLNSIEFVLTLKDDDFIQHINSNDGILNIGPIPPEECPSLYAECDAMFLPTLAECFSATYPEAMIMEKPIVTTHLGFARSICGEAALYYVAKNENSAADQIERLVKDEALQKDLIIKGKKQLNNFDSPQKRAQKYLELCRTLAES